MEKPNDPTIHVSLTENRDPSDWDDSGEYYCAVVMAWEKPRNEKPGTWYNTGIVCWATNARNAFEKAFKEYEEIYG